MFCIILKAGFFVSLFSEPIFFLTFCDLHFLLIQNGFYLENTYVISMHAHVVFLNLENQM